MRHNGMIARLAQNAHQAQAIRPARDPYNDRLIAVEPTLIAKNGLNVFKHYMDTEHLKVLRTFRVSIRSDTTPPGRLMCFRDGRTRIVCHLPPYAVPH